MPFGVFLFSSLVARSLRFFAVATLLYYFGAPIRNFIEKRLGLVFTVFIFVLIAGFFMIRII
jgi:membrane protein DedA with SNARE-associated domain